MRGADPWRLGDGSGIEHGEWMLSHRPPLASGTTRVERTVASSIRCGCKGSVAFFSLLLRPWRLAKPRAHPHLPKLKKPDAKKSHGKGKVGWSGMYPPQPRLTNGKASPSRADGNLLGDWRRENGPRNRRPGLEGNAGPALKSTPKKHGYGNELASERDAKR